MDSLDSAARLGSLTAEDGIALLSLLPDMACVASTDGYFKRLNPAWERSLGWTEEELLSRPVMEFIHSEDLEATREEGEKHASGKPTVDFVNRFRSKDGSYRWLRWRAIPAKDPNLLYATARDITPRMVGEEELRRTAAMLKALSDATPSLMFVKDFEGRLLLANPERESEAEIERLAAQFDATFYSIAEPVFIFSTDARTVRASRAATSFLGYDPVGNLSWENARRSSMRYSDGTLVDRELLPSVRALRGETVVGERYNFTNALGQDLVMEVSASPTIASGGGGAVVIWHDITERERGFESLQRSEERLRLGSQAAGFGTYSYDFDTREDPWSQEFTALSGFDADDPFPMDEERLRARVHPEDREAVLAAMKAANDPTGAGVLRLEYRILRPDGSIRWLRLMGHTDFVGIGEKRRPWRAAGAVVDITESKEAEDALREREARLSGILLTTPDGFWISDRNGRIVLVNDAYCEMSGYSREELLGMTISDVEAMENPEEVAEHIKTLAMDGGGSFETRHRRKDGRVIDVEISIRYTGNGEGFASTRVTTERKQMERQLLRAQRLETAGLVAGQVAHDFNNLLGPMLGYPELMKMQLPRDHPMVPMCDSMMEAAQQMADINTDMLALSRRGLLGEQPVDLNRLARRAIQDLGSLPPTLSVELNLSEGLPPVSGSDAQLIRVLSNLLSNAREAMHDAGLLTISTENVYVDRPFARYNRVDVGEYVLLSVADTGCGIPLEVRDRIFDAFFTTKETTRKRGSGLGLSVVQTIVEDHRGYIDMESQPGMETTFRVYLPVLWQPEEARVAEAARGGDETILVVDDDPMQREVSRNILERIGYRVEVAESGEEALKKLAQGPIALLVLDMVMPGGIDGSETYRRAVEMRPGQRAILMSGFAETELVTGAQALGAGAYLRKPVTVEQLARAVREELERRR